MSSGGGGGGSQSTTTVQKADPWAGQQPYLKTIFKEAETQYNSTTPAYYPGKVTAAVDPATTQAQGELVNAAGQQGQIATDTAAANQFNMTDAKDVRSNPYLQSAIQAAINPMIQNFNDAGGVMSNIRTQGEGAQSGGGTRQGIAEGIAASRLNQQIGDVASTMASKGYETGLDASVKSVALAPQVQGMQATEAQTLDAVGQQRQAYAQQAINDLLDKWNWEQNLPGAKLAQFQNMVQGNYGGTSSGYSTSEGGMPQRNPIMGAMGGALAGAQIGSMIPGIGTGVGAGIGALLSFL